MTQKMRQIVIQRYWEEFDTTDQDAWDALRSRLENNLTIDFADYPENAPEDQATWFELYKALYHLEYENQEEDDWLSDRKGTTEYQFILTDESGDEVMSEGD
jgi:hypothetical protein